METDPYSLLDSNESICWNPSFRIEILPEEGVFLFSERGNSFLTGKICMQLAPLLQEGKYSADALADLLHDQHSAAEIYYAISCLEKKHLVQGKKDVLSRHTAAFCGLLDVSENVALQRLQSTKIFVQSFADASFAEAIDPQFLSTLQDFGLKLVDTPEQADFSIVCVEDYLQPALLTFNRSAFARKHPWLLVRPYGSQIWMGPFFHSGHAGCYECLSRRLKTNRLEESWVQQKKDLPSLFPPAHAMLPTTQKWAWNWVATEVFKRVVTGRSDSLAHKILTFDFLESALKEHFITQLPYCSCCSDASSDPAQTPSPPTFKPGKKRNGSDGGYRCSTPEETLKKYATHVSPITGVVHSLAPAPKVSSPGIHVYVGGHNRALSGKNLGKNIKNFRTACGGKGLSDAQAKASCLCESVERFSGEFQGDEPRIRGSFQELKDRALHPDSVLLFSQQQYLHRETTNRKGHRFHYVSPQVPEEMSLEWSPIWSLTEQKFKYYPTPLCYYSYPSSDEKTRFGGDSNGCAAGNCLEEAVLQGFLELVERDSVAIWWYNRLQRPCIDLNTFQSPHLTAFVEEYARMGREIWVVDITSDLGIPSFAALSRMKNSDREVIFMGFGAHLDPYIGVMRAMTEMNQFLAVEPYWEDSSPGPKEEETSYETEREWFRSATVENQPWLKASSVLAASDLPQWESADLLEDINYCRHCVESRGMQVLVLDQTRPEIGLSVARVIVPGLRHFWPRYAPGRLYDVPVKMGWLKEPLKESELNPIGMFL